MIDNHTLEYLLKVQEGPTLDFKSEQYRFDKATTKDKGELLKDILAFTNSTRDSTAYILIGVAEVKGGRSEIVGVENHLDDACLHQFVNSKTNRPVEFSYTPCAIEGKSIGIISIPIQQRPVWAENEYGVVKADEVYIRDGSSTRQALPGEIADMGRGNPPNLQVEWGDATMRTVYPTDYVHRNTGLRLPDEFQTWDGNSGHYDFEALAKKLGGDPGVYEGHRFTTIRQGAMYRSLGLRFYNNSGSVGENVRFTGTLENAKDVRFHQPKDRRCQWTESGGGVEIIVEVGHIRPGEYVWAGQGFQLSTKRTGTLIWKARFVGDNLPEPIEYLLPLQVQYEEREIQAKDLKSSLIPRPSVWLS